MKLIDRIIEKLYFKRFPERNPKSFSVAELIAHEKHYNVRNIAFEELIPLEYYERLNEVDLRMHFINKMRDHLINYIAIEETEDFADRINYQVRIRATLKVLEEDRNEINRR